MLAKVGRHNSHKPLSPAAFSLLLGVVLAVSVALFNSSSSAAEERSVTICHVTGSQTNPHVEVTVDEMGFPAHLEPCDPDV